MDEEKRASRLNLALSGIKAGTFTIKEAEEIFSIKISDELHPTKDKGFYFEPKHPDYHGWADYFIKQNKYFHSDSGDFIYDNKLKYYRRSSRSETQSHINTDTKGKFKPQHINHFLSTLQTMSYKTFDRFKSTDGLVNLSNGYLNVKTGEMFEHDSNVFFTYCLPHAYDRMAKCDRWMRFLDEVFAGAEELKIIAAQIFGYVLLGGNPWLHRAFVLYGEGRNGKSTFLDVLRCLVGQRNHASVSLSKLNLPFSVVHLDGKLANIVEETPNDKINAEAFKTAIGGGQLMGARKYENEYLFDCNARFIFACNEFPHFSENSVGLHERLYFVPFNAYFEKDKRDGNILNELKSEMSGILNWALSGLSLLLEDKVLADTASSNNTFEQYKRESDSVYSWAEEFVSFDAGVEYLSCKSVYIRYRNDMKESGKHPVSDNTFFKRLNKYLKEKEPKILNKRDKHNRGFGNMRLKITI
jgi:P4 family phage/plasmid primase-like protien